MSKLDELDLEHMDELEDENARLRELVQKAIYIIEDNCALCAYRDACEILSTCKCVARYHFREDAKKLGIEG